jgi:site-specific DNA-methyltransferase (adenine-specific)
MSVRILIGDCVERMREMPDNSVDSVVCDPPYHLTSIVKRFSKAKPRAQMHDKHKGNIKAAQYSRLSKGFMGQSWDGGDVAFQSETWAEVLRVLKPGGHLIAFSGTRTYHRMACSIEDAGFEIRDQLAWAYGSGFPKSHNQPGGWGTALKPSWEPIALARKPLNGTVAANMAKWGTGALNIDGCRIEAAGRPLIESKSEPSISTFGDGLNGSRHAGTTDQGRWPANLCHDGSDEVVAGFPETESGLYKAGSVPKGVRKVYGQDAAAGYVTQADTYGDSGSAARFFYCAKATTEERGAGNNHPTVKPVSLMRWLVRLVTPKGGTVLDPFMGSGSTLIAADAEQFNAIGCELSSDYAVIAEKRVRNAAGLFADISIEHTGPSTRAA